MLEVRCTQQLAAHLHDVGNCMYDRAFSLNLFRVQGFSLRVQGFRGSNPEPAKPSTLNPKPQHPETLPVAPKLQTLIELLD